MSEANGAIGWDDEVSEPENQNAEKEDFVVLPDGQYPFVVNKVERGTFKGSAKLPPCNMVKVGIIVDGDDAGRSYVNARFFMHTKMLFRIFQFLEAVGLHKKGDGAKTIPWSKVTKGLTGHCAVKTHVYNGEQYSEVDRWLAAVEKPEEEMPY